MSILTKYMDLLELKNIKECNLENLIKLQTKHIQVFVHTNIDVVLKRKISLEIEDIINKFQYEHKAGLCHELNCAFYFLLKTLGYHVDLVSTMVHAIEDRKLAFSMDPHVVIIANLPPTEYFIDVGWGNQFSQPINLNNGYIQEINGDFKLTAYGKKLGLYKLCQDQSWHLQYSFEKKPVIVEQLLPHLKYVCESQDHSFGKVLFAYLRNNQTHKSLINNLLTIKNPTHNKKLLLPNTKEIQKTLQQEFALNQNLATKLNDDLLRQFMF